MRKGLVSAAAANATPQKGTKSYYLGLNLLDSLGAVKEYLPLFKAALDYPDSEIQITARRSLEDVGIYPSQLKR
jgi:hypothetical protein